MAYVLDTASPLGHGVPMFDDDAPRRPRGRPRIHADSKAAASARAVAHQRAKRADMHERVVHLNDATSVRADSLMEERRLTSFTALVLALVDEGAERRS